MTQLIVQKVNGDEVGIIEVNITAPMVLTFDGVIHYRVHLRKFGDAIYRPCSFHTAYANEMRKTDDKS